MAVVAVQVRLGAQHRIYRLFEKSGPKRYDYNEQNNTWVYSRDGQSLPDLLNRELSDVLQRSVDVTKVVE